MRRSFKHLGLLLLLALGTVSCSPTELFTISGHLVKADGAEFQRTALVILNPSVGSGAPSESHMIEARNGRFSVDVVPGGWRVQAGIGTCQSEVKEVSGGAGDAVNLTLIINCVP